MTEISARGLAKTAPSSRERVQGIKLGSGPSGWAMEINDYQEEARPGQMFLVVGIAGVLFWMVAGVALWLLWNYPFAQFGELDIDDCPLIRLAETVINRKALTAS